ncbi:MAG: hypothetical protein GX589_01405 [Deltaproteobacteria bacterium]|nr:hypothetical protein [Deltaproteobacteria bacterium]
MNQSPNLQSKLVTASTPALTSTWTFPANIALIPCERLRGVLVRWNHEVDLYDPSRDPLLEFYLPVDANSLAQSDWEQRMQEHLMQLGAGVFEAEIANGIPPLSTLFYRNIAAFCEFEAVKGCKITLGSAPVLRLADMARLEDVDIEDAIVLIQGKKVEVQNIKCTRSHLVLNCENCAFDMLEVDEESCLSGSVCGSVFSKSCSIHGYAMDCNFIGAVWKQKILEELRTSLRGIKVSADKIEGPAFLKIVEETKAATSSKDLQVKTWSTRRLIQLVDSLTGIWDCQNWDERNLRSTQFLKLDSYKIASIRLPRVCGGHVSKLEIPLEAQGIPGVLVSFDYPQSAGVVPIAERVLANKAEIFDCLLEYLAAYSTRLGTLFADLRFEEFLLKSFAQIKGFE